MPLHGVEVEDVRSSADNGTVVAEEVLPINNSITLGTRTHYASSVIKDKIKCRQTRGLVCDTEP